MLVQNNRGAAFWFIKFMFCNTKNACSKQAGAAFLFIKLLFVTQIKQEAAF